jgi:hypothetical protein
MVLAGPDLPVSDPAGAAGLMEGRVIDAFDEDTGRWYTARVRVEPQPADAAGKLVTLCYVACGLEDALPRNAADIIYRRCWKERTTFMRGAPIGPAEEVYLNVLLREVMRGSLGDDFVDQSDFRSAVQGLVDRGSSKHVDWFNSAFAPSGQGRKEGRSVLMDAETRKVKKETGRTYSASANRSRTNLNTYKPDLNATATQVANARALVEKARVAFLLEVRERTPGVTDQLGSTGLSVGYTACLKSKSHDFNGAGSKRWQSQRHSSPLGAMAARDRRLMQLGFADRDLFFWTPAEIEHAEKSDTKNMKEACSAYEAARDELSTLLAKPLLAGGAERATAEKGRAAAQARFDAAATNYARYAKGAAAEFEAAQGAVAKLVAAPLPADEAGRAAAVQGRAAARERQSEWYWNGGGRERRSERYWHGGGRERQSERQSEWYWNGGGREEYLEQYWNGGGKELSRELGRERFRAKVARRPWEPSPMPQKPAYDPALNTALPLPLAPTAPALPFEGTPRSVKDAAAIKRRLAAIERQRHQNHRSALFDVLTL